MTLSNALGVVQEYIILTRVISTVKINIQLNLAAAVTTWNVSAVS